MPRREHTSKNRLMDLARGFTSLTLGPGAVYHCPNVQYTCVPYPPVDVTVSIQVPGLTGSEEYSVVTLTGSGGFFSDKFSVAEDIWRTLAKDGALSGQEIREHIQQIQTMQMYYDQLLASSRFSSGLVRDAAALASDRCRSAFRRWNECLSHRKVDLALGWPSEQSEPQKAEK